MNADKQVVPIVEEDQGEGWVDLINNANNILDTCIKCKQQFIRKAGSKTKRNKSPKREFLCDWCKRQQKSNMIQDNKKWR